MVRNLRTGYLSVTETFKLRRRMDAVDPAGKPKKYWHVAKKICKLDIGIIRDDEKKKHVEQEVIL